MIWQTLLAIFGVVLTLLFVIGTHEAAHFIVARWLNVKVLRFSIGFGKAFYRWHDKTGTEYVLAMIPLGGYVKMLDEREGDVPEQDKPFAFNRQPFYKKFLIVLAGPVINLACAWLLYWLIFMIGFVSFKPIVGPITPHSIAAAGGLQANQEITKVDNKVTPTWNHVLLQLLLHAGNQDHAVLETKQRTTQKAQTHVLNLSQWRLDELNPNPLLSLGIKPREPPTLITIQYGPFDALIMAWQQMIDFTTFNFVMIGKMISGKISIHSLGGPITIFETAGTAFTYGIVPFFAFLAFLSISIGIINLLPIPGLDGGHLFTQLIEVVIRRPIPDRIMVPVYYFGFVLLLLLLMQAVVNDLLRLL